MEKIFLNNLSNNIKISFKNPKDKKNNLLVKNKIKVLKKNYLNSKNYYVILKNPSFREGNIKQNVIKLSKFFGKTLPQNGKGKKYLIVKPDLKKLKSKSRKKIKEKLRYHQTNLGGSIHSDGPQLNTPPKYVIMGCLDQAQKGGQSILVSVNKLYRYLKRKKPQILNILKKEFFFERRGFGNKIFTKPIITKKTNTIIFRYLREYIVSGYKKKNKELKYEKIVALNYLDRLLRKKEFQYKYKMNKGDIIILNNYLMAHGRSGFSLDKSKKKRSLIRIWIR